MKSAFWFVGENGLGRSPEGVADGVDVVEEIKHEHIGSPDQN